MDNKRKPVPAGGQPTPAAIATANATPPSSPPKTAVASDNDKPKQDDGELIDARVLIAFDDYFPDQIVSDSPAAIEALKLAGKADPHPDAVAFARSLAE